MKKNKSLRAAAILLALTLITTSIISGTFANYVTKGEGNGTARTAKWGIKIAVTGDELFKTTYDTDDTASATVIATSTTTGEGESAVTTQDNVVAPGTASRAGKGLHIVVNGTAETSFYLAVSMTGPTVSFTDLYGRIFRYEVTMVNHAESTDSITSGEDDLTLFARSRNTSKYVIIRCRLSNM